MLINANHSIIGSIQRTSNTVKSAQNPTDAKTLNVAADKVSISSEASKRLSLENKRKDFLASFSPEDAAAYSQSLVNNTIKTGDIGGLLDISGLEQGGDGIIRYAGDHSPVTEESNHYFEKESARFFEQRKQLYQTEIEKNTPPNEILAKLLSLEDSQPSRLQMMMGWNIV